MPDGVTIPALVKAAAGGGGRGMRDRARSADELAGAIEAASREAQSAFGDGTVFVEPYIERGRHVEVQIMGDTHGNVVHFGERECSIQRRNQKVIEEAPSPGITDDDPRRRCCDGALALARHVGYQNAGTVEFLVGDDGTINFLEVNTRLQVEHPVTEAVTGLDLVELQLWSPPASRCRSPQARRRASTGTRSRSASSPRTRPRGWLPSTGTITAFEIGDGVRVDTGFRAGAVVSADYDSLLAKVIAHAPDQDAGGAHAGHGRCATPRSPACAPTSTRWPTSCSSPTSSPAARRRRTSTDHPEVLTARRSGRRRTLALAARRRVRRRAADRAADPVLGFAPSGWRNLRTQGQRETWIDLDAPATSITSSSSCTGATGRRVHLGPWPHPTDDGSLSPDERGRLDVRLLDRTPTRQVVEVDGMRSAVDVRIEPSRRARRRRWSSRAARRVRDRSSGRRRSPITTPTSGAAGRSPRCPAR